MEKVNLFKEFEKTIERTLKEFSKDSLMGLENLSNANNNNNKIIEDYDSEIIEELVKMNIPFYNLPLEYGGYELGEEIKIMILKQLGIFSGSSSFVSILNTFTILLMADDKEFIKKQMHIVQEKAMYSEVIGLKDEINRELILQKDDEYIVTSDEVYVTNFNNIHSFIFIIDEEVYMVPKERKGINFNIDKKSSDDYLVNVKLDNLLIYKDDRIGQGNIDINLAITFARLHQASYLLGLAIGALNEAIDYTNRRRQFQKKLIENQSISFKLASLLTDLHAIDLKIDKTTWCLENKLDNVLQSATEDLAYISELALLISREALHLHGAYGMTKYSKIEKFYRLIGVESVRFGTPNSLWLSSGKLIINNKELS
ncbi:acyl-CoA dehydrogenase family protein [Bacillus cereus]|uniref:acyl-CoA dehydrogenase family protein n=1 Tax=Bacillus cereus TaxID=1396 RepID=UPI001F32A6F1|nr:acyl-CoA dehydrogenase family protein [Bacillus cereus]